MVVSSTDGLFTDFTGKLMFNPQSPQLGKIVVEVTPGSVHTDEEARDRTEAFIRGGGERAVA